LSVTKVPFCHALVVSRSNPPCSIQRSSRTHDSQMHQRQRLAALSRYTVFSTIVPFLDGTSHAILPLVAGRKCVAAPRLVQQRYFDCVGPTDALDVVPPKTASWYISTSSPISAVSPMTTPMPWSMKTRRPILAHGGISIPVSQRLGCETSPPRKSSLCSQRA